MPAGRKEPGRDSPPDRAGSFGAECSPVGERWNGTEAVSSRAEGWRVGVVLSPAGGGAVRGYEEFGAGEEKREKKDKEVMTQADELMLGQIIHHQDQVMTGQKAAEPEVTIACGLLRGKQVNVKGTDRLVNVFLGIPFAKALVGSLRFSPPEPPDPWNDLKDATSYPLLCPQDLTTLKKAEKSYKEKHIQFRTSEDCLYLNGYSPADKKNKLPVVVWIHGGNFVFGGASRCNGSALSTCKNIVVVVIIQYRLGLLGFFNTGDEHARGNWAFLDQEEALQWVRENIEHFGGDPGSVTLFGVSAGSCCVFAQVLSTLSKGLFHKAILESGVLIPSNKDLLLSADLKEIPFLPLVLDGVFLHKSPEDTLAGKEFNMVLFMIGVTNNEFGWNIKSILERLLLL
ncbi:putative inactive carboxylesterase 4 [Lagopus muta]|uniref:putative inactive carboxylesterase 4 n=1 Tax=Lagopus muta TaxID=64668 RepID=UPI00209E1219|nr:putative inactive carboxylesterase 4 [Lagopus muta]